MSERSRRVMVVAVAVAMATAMGCGKDGAPDGAGNGGPHGGRGPGGPGGPGARGVPPTPVAVEEAGRGAIASYYTTTASLDANREAEILSRVSGVITRLDAEEGDVVRRDQNLLGIGDTEYAYRLRQAEAAVAKQKNIFDRLQRMLEQNFTSTEEYETARSDYEAAVAARDLAALELSYTRVTAPFGGQVVERYVDVGQNVSPGTTLFRIADLERLLARVHVPAREFRKIQTDQVVELLLDSNQQRLAGRIILVSPIIDPTNGTIKVTVEVTDYPPDTRPGDFAEVRIVTERHEDALLVPAVAVVNDRGQQVVYVAGAEGTAERRPVEVGFQDEHHAEIVRGLDAGEPVVIQGQRSLRPDAPIKVMDAVDLDATSSPDST